MRLSGNQCTAVKSNGQACQGRAASGSQFCFFHDPDKSEERRLAGQKGGRAGKVATLSSDSPDIKIDTAQDVVTLIGETISQVRRGEIDPRVANAIGYLSGVALRAREQGDLEERMNKLEEEVERKGSGNVTPIRKTG